MSSPLAADNVLHVLLGLMLVLAAVLVTAWFLRRFLRIDHGLNGQLKVLSGVSMGNRERAVLLQVGDKQLLIGVAPGCIRTLHVLDQPMLSETPPGEAKSDFARQLRQALQGVGATGRGRRA